MPFFNIKRYLKEKEIELEKEVVYIQTQVSSTENELTSMISSISTNTTNITNLQTQVSSTENELLTSMNSSISTNTTNITNLQTQLDSHETCSYTTRDYPITITGGPNYNWVTTNTDILNTDINLLKLKEHTTNKLIQDRVYMVSGQLRVANLDNIRVFALQLSILDENDNVILDAPQSYIRYDTNVGNAVIFSVSTPVHSFKSTANYNSFKLRVTSTIFLNTLAGDVTLLFSGSLWSL